jgi:hypothetical protein
MSTAAKRPDRLGPFEDYFVVSRVGRGERQVFMLDLPTSGEIPEDNAMIFSAAISHLKRNPSCPAVRFKIDGWLMDFDPCFANRKPRRAKRA